MEGMPVSKHPDLTTQQRSVQATPKSNPTVVEKLVDAITHKTQARPASAFLKKRNKNKRVRWDRSVIFNEKMLETPSARPSSPPLPKGTLRKGSASPSSSQLLSTNSSVNMDSPSVRPSYSVTPRGHSTFPGQYPLPAIQHSDNHVTAAVSRRPPTYHPSTQRPDQAPGANSVSKTNLDPATRRHVVLEIEVTALSPNDIQQKSTRRPQITASRAPPAVPDAPQPQMQGPPATPRITRLPTPDLPDISRRKFCVCNSAKCKTLVNHKGKPVQVKMNAQMEAAKAYMKRVKK